MSHVKIVLKSLMQCSELLNYFSPAGYGCGKYILKWSVKNNSVGLMK